MTVDEALLARQKIETRQEEQQAAEAVRMAKRQEADAAAVEEMEDDMRAAKRASVIKREQEKKSLKEQAKDKAEEVVFSPIRKATGWFLRFSWLNFISSFGLTLIGIDIYVFFQYIFRGMFCRLGEEWTSSQSVGFGLSKEEQERLNSVLRTIEKMVWIFLNVVMIAATIGFIGSFWEIYHLR
jgi:hypothetical protein